MQNSIPLVRDMLDTCWLAILKHSTFVWRDLSVSGQMYPNSLFRRQLNAYMT